MFYHNIKCVVTDVKVCRVCKKKIGNRSEACSVYVRHNPLLMSVIEHVGFH